MFTIDVLPAARGDCLWLEYGLAHRPSRVLIDGGLIATSREHLRPRIEALPITDRRFDLLVITHIDLDHIAGILELLRDPPEGLTFDDVWFNGWKHLPEDEGVLGAKQGEAVSFWLEQHGWSWNRRFEGGAVCTSDDAEQLPKRTLTGGLTMTLLSPARERLLKLADTWKEEIKAQGLEPGNAGAELEGIGHPEDRAEEDIGLLGGIDISDLAASNFRPDRSVANGSSIALLAEFAGRRVLLAADAFAGDVLRSVGRIAAAEGEDLLTIDALKLSHHGGRKNTSRELLAHLRCNRYVFSTDGSAYDHPDPESIARALVHGAHSGRPSLIFNYRSDETAVWDNAELFDGEHPYDLVYPDGEGITIEL